MTSSTLSVRVAAGDKDRLEKLAESTGRSRSFLAADAIREYLDAHEWQVAGVRAALQSLESNGGVAHEQVKDWVESWDSDQPSPAPRPRKP
jgi:predicted transcriptional regulator